MNLRLRLNKISTCCSIIFLILLEPKLFVKFNIINYVYALASVGCLFCLLIPYCVTGKKLPTVFLFAALMRMSFFVQTIIANGDILQWGYLTVVILSIVLAFDLYFAAYPLRFLKSLQNVLLAYAIINYISMVVFPNGLIDGNYFLGIRTRMTEWLFPLTAISMMIDRMMKKKMSLKTLTVIGIGIITILHQWIATALMGIIVMLLVYYILNTTKRFMHVGLVTLTICGILVSIAIVFFQAQNLFSGFIENFLHKEVDLTFRTSIWANAIVKIFSNPIFGYGLPDNGLHVTWIIERQTHNHWMQILCDGGLVYFATFMFFTASCGKKIKAIFKTPLAKIYLACYAAFMIMAVSEIYIYSPIFFVLLLLGKYLPFAYGKTS